MNCNYYTGAFLQLTEIPPVEPQPLEPLFQHYFDINQTNTTCATSSYDMTVGMAGGGEFPPAPTILPVQPHHHYEQRKRCIQHFEEYGALATCTVPVDPVPSTSTAPMCRRRNTLSFDTASAYEHENEPRSSRSMLPDKKQNHSEIEKRRRDKMNMYISELSSMIPMCSAMSRKLDKLTVLRMAVQHLRSIRGSLSNGPLTTCPRPAYVTERELNKLVLSAGQKAFLLVVGCDRGRVLYVSTSVTQMLQYDKEELLGQSLFDILHPKDVAKVKEQLSSADLSPRERLIDAKTMLPVKVDTISGASRLCPGARRSFFCRIKSKTAVGCASVKEEHTQPAGRKMRKKHEKKYCVVQCTGYLKSWAPVEMAECGNGNSGFGSGGEEETCSLSCLVAVGRALHDLAPQPDPVSISCPVTQKLQFFSRHANDGKYLFVDQRVTLALGFLPQELLGTSLYEYVLGPEHAVVARAHKAALMRRGAPCTSIYSARRKDGTTALLQTHFKPFKSPWTKDVECLVAQNTVITEAFQSISETTSAFEEQAESPQAGDFAADDFNMDSSLLECGAVVQRLIDFQVESHKIGNAIAEDVMRRSPTSCNLELPSDTLQDDLLNNTQSCDNFVGDTFQQIRNNVPLSDAAGSESPSCMEYDAPSSPVAVTTDGNGEAAMAVIMSLLEADAGLGGQFNFSGPQWPLP